MRAGRLGGEKHPVACDQGDCVDRQQSRKGRKVRGRDHAARLVERQAIGQRIHIGFGGGIPSIHRRGEVVDVETRHVEGGGHGERAIRFDELGAVLKLARWQIEGTCEQCRGDRAGHDLRAATDKGLGHSGFPSGWVYIGEDISGEHIQACGY